VRCEEEDVGGVERRVRVGECAERPAPGRSGEMMRRLRARAWGLPQGAFVAGGGVAVEVGGWWGCAGWIAVFAPGHGAAIWESEWVLGLAY
jgi:hypothetical protein